MRAYIVLEWKEGGKAYQRNIWRNDFFKYLNNISENSDVSRKVKALAKEVDSICVNADEDETKQEKNLIFTYNENLDFNENTQSLEISADNKDNKMYYFVKSYCKEIIVFRVLENNQEKIRSKSKQQVISIMQAIKNAYPDNNEISTKLCEVLPDTYSIFINKDRNNACPENPIIICHTVKEEKYKVITVMNNHKIIWAHLNEWCH